MLAARDDGWSRLTSNARIKQYVNGHQPEDKDTEYDPERAVANVTTQDNDHIRTLNWRSIRVHPFVIRRVPAVWASCTLNQKQYGFPTMLSLTSCSWPSHWSEYLSLGKSLHPEFYWPQLNPVAFWKGWTNRSVGWPLLPCAIFQLFAYPAALWGGFLAGICLHPILPDVANYALGD